MTPPRLVELDRADPEAWAAALGDYELEQSRRLAAAEVRAGFLRYAIATCGLPFSDAPATRPAVH